MVHPDSGGIFSYLSKDIWSLSSEYFHGNPAYKIEMNLTGAMKLCTIEVLKECCPNISFHPTFDRVKVEG